MATSFTTIQTSQTFACGECNSPVVLTQTPAGELVYECQNARCQKCVSVDVPEALALVEDVTIQEQAEAVKPSKAQALCGRTGIELSNAELAVQHKLTDKQAIAYSQLPADGSWGTPLSTTHNGTLVALLRKGLIKWSHGPYMGQAVWKLSYGNFCRASEPDTRMCQVWDIDPTSPQPGGEGTITERMARIWS